MPPQVDFYFDVGSPAAYLAFTQIEAIAREAGASVNHKPMLLGGVFKAIDTYPDFKMKPEAVEAAITEKTKILIINSPANPTGVTLDKEELAALAAG